MAYADRPHGAARWRRRPSAFGPPAPDPARRADLLERRAGGVGGDLRRRLRAGVLARAARHLQAVRHPSPALDQLSGPERRAAVGARQPVCAPGRYRFAAGLCAPPPSSRWRTGASTSTGGSIRSASVRAVVADIRRRHAAEGASTITQQLARNLFLTPDQTIKRKVQELLLAVWLEHQYSKKQILALYLNRVYFGAGAYGVESASETFFNKPASKLTIGEAALLAALLKSPTHYSPVNEQDRAGRRATIVLDKMVETHAITPEQREEALSPSGARLPPRSPPSTPSISSIGWTSRCASSSASPPPT